MKFKADGTPVKNIYDHFTDCTKENAALRSRVASLEAENLKLIRIVIDRNMELGYYAEHLIERRDELQSRAQASP